MQFGAIPFLYQRLRVNDTVAFSLMLGPSFSASFDFQDVFFSVGGVRPLSGSESFFVVGGYANLSAELFFNKYWGLGIGSSINIAPAKTTTLTPSTTAYDGVIVGKTSENFFLMEISAVLQVIIRL